MFQSERNTLVILAALLLVSLVFGGASVAQAQLLYSFETGLEGFEPGPGGDSDYIDHLQSTTGATDGTMALEIETASGFGRDVVVNETVPGDPRYDLFNTVAANPSIYSLDFDVTFTEASWPDPANLGTFFDINVFSNSDLVPGFKEQFGVTSGTPGSASVKTGSLPASQLSLIPDSSFFQLGFGTNSNHGAGPGNEGVKYYVDNIRFTEIPQFNEVSIFSWETLDDPGTPEVNEQLEGWRDGFSDAPYFHTRTLVSGDGVTDGNSALQFEQPESGFAWGSQFTLSSDGAPSNQARIDQLISDVNSADRLAFDVTFPDDQFPFNPTFLTLFMNISDEAGTFYQSPNLQAGNPMSDSGSTQTIEFPLSEMTAGSMNLADDGLQPGNFFRLALATNSDSGVTFTIDNIRLLTEESSNPADLNNDGFVDGLDLGILLGNFEQNASPAGGELNGTDPVDGLDLGILLGAWNPPALSAVASVPEPSTLLLLGLSVSLALTKRRLR